MGGPYAIVYSKQCIRHGGGRVVGLSRDTGMIFDTVTVFWGYGVKVLF